MSLEVEASTGEVLIYTRHSEKYRELLHALTPADAQHLARRLSDQAITAHHQQQQAAQKRAAADCITDRR